MPSESFTAPAHFQSTERISCLVPSFGIRNISVSVANNGHDFSNSVNLQVIQAPSISSINPSAGPSQGGIPLRLRVRELNPALTPYYSHLSCRFGMIDVLAVLQDGGNSVLCILPGQLANSTIDVSVVDDGRAVVNNSIKFTYTSPPFIHGIAPSMGPVGGSTLVSLSIDEFFCLTYIWVLVHLVHHHHLYLVLHMDPKQNHLFLFVSIHLEGLSYQTTFVGLQKTL